MKVVILENIRSLHNVGAIFRTADGAGWDKIYLTGYTGCPPDRRIEKVSLGAEEFLPWEHVDSAKNLCKQLKKNGFEIIALEQSDRAEDIFTIEHISENIALILGNEVDGVSSEILQESDRHLEIPMYGKKTSLNVSIAAGIALFAIQKLQ